MTLLKCRTGMTFRSGSENVRWSGLYGVPCIYKSHPFQSRFPYLRLDRAWHKHYFFNIPSVTCAIPACAASPHAPVQLSAAKLAARSTAASVNLLPTGVALDRSPHYVHGIVTLFFRTPRHALLLSGFQSLTPSTSTPASISRSQPSRQLSTHFALMV